LSPKPQPRASRSSGDFRRAVLFDREETSIAVGTANEDFIRNIVRVLAECRAAFAVLRPTAFVKVDLIACSSRKTTAKRKAHEPEATVKRASTKAGCRNCDHVQGDHRDYGPGRCRLCDCQGFAK
jgi:hypothetical protein